MLPESHRAVLEVVVCGMVSTFFHCTVSPTWMTTPAGLNTRPDAWFTVTVAADAEPVRTSHVSRDALRVETIGTSSFAGAGLPAPGPRDGGRTALIRRGRRWRRARRARLSSRRGSAAGARHGPRRGAGLDQRGDLLHLAADP